MTAADKKLIESMITALEAFEDCLPHFSNVFWSELCQKFQEGKESLPTWNEISAVKKRLQTIRDEIS